MWIAGVIRDYAGSCPILGLSKLALNPKSGHEASIKHHFCSQFSMKSDNPANQIVIGKVKKKREWDG
jgi:hypothetical protein